MKKYVICKDNTGYQFSLILNKIYKIGEDKSNMQGMINVIDESGEGYFYSKDRFKEVIISEDESFIYKPDN